MSEQQQYEDLKKECSDKGYMGMSKENRTKYSELKKRYGEKAKDGNKVIPSRGLAQVKSTASPADVKSTEEMVPMSKVQDMINASIENYRKIQPSMPEKAGEWKEVERGKGANKTAKLRLYQEDSESPFGVIVRADYHKTVWDEETHKHDKMLYKVEVLYEDGSKKSLEMDAIEYSKINVTEDVELIKNDRKEMRMSSGKIGRPMRDKDGYPIYKMNAGGYGAARDVIGEVDLEVIRYDETFTVRRPNGQEFEIHSKYLNA